MSAGAPWKTDAGRTGVELERKSLNSRTLVKLLMLPAFPGWTTEWHDTQQLHREPARYEGARGGRVRP